MDGSCQCGGLDGNYAGSDCTDLTGYSISHCQDTYASTGTCDGSVGCEMADQAFGGPSRIIPTLPGYADGSHIMLGYSGKSLGDKISMAVTDSSFYFDRRMTLWSIFTGEFHFAGSANEGGSLDDDGDIYAGNAVELVMSGQVEIDLALLKAPLLRFVRDEMLLPKFIDKIDNLVNLGAKDFCKAVGTPSVICKVVPSLSDLVDGVKVPIRTLQTELSEINLLVETIIDGFFADPRVQGAFSAALKDEMVGANRVTRATIEWEGSLAGVDVKFGPFKIKLDASKVLDINALVMDAMDDFVVLISEDVMDSFDVSSGRRRLTHADSHPRRRLQSLQTVDSLVQEYLDGALADLTNAADNGFQFLDDASSSVLGAIQNGWSGIQTGFDDLFESGSGTCKSKSYGFKQCKKCGSADEQMIINDRNAIGGNNGAGGGKGKCFSACLDISTDVFERWMAATQFQAYKCNFAFVPAVPAQPAACRSPDDQSNFDICTHWSGSQAECQSHTAMSGRSCRYTAPVPEVPAVPAYTAAPGEVPDATNPVWSQVSIGRGQISGPFGYQPRDQRDSIGRYTLHFAANGVDVTSDEDCHSLCLNDMECVGYALHTNPTDSTFVCQLYDELHTSYMAQGCAPTTDCEGTEPNQCAHVRTTGTSMEYNTCSVFGHTPTTGSTRPCETRTASIRDWTVGACCYLNTDGNNCAITPGAYNRDDDGERTQHLATASYFCDSIGDDAMAAGKSAC